MLHRHALLLFAMASVLLGPVTAGASVVHGMAFPERVEIEDGARLQLCSAELLRYKRIFRGYVAALYLEDCTQRERPLADVPRRLELSYFWAIPGRLFGPAAESVLENSFAETQLAALRDRLEILHAAYRDVEPGDRYSLTYVPGIGTELALNGAPLVRIPGADFARAYFSIWLGPKPVDPGLRDRLLQEPAPARAKRASLAP